MTTLLTNIDNVRAEIMRLENATMFDQRAWAQVLIALTDRPNARADAARRMATAKHNQQANHAHQIIRPLLGRAYCEPCLKQFGVAQAVAVAVETEAV